MGKYKKPKPKYNNLLKIFLVILAIVFVSVAVNLWQTESETTSNAVVEGKMFAVVPKIPGLVMSIYVDTNSEVKKGDLIIELDRAFYEHELRQAEDSLKEAQKELYDNKENEPKVSKSPLSRFKFNHAGFFDGYSKLYGDDINQADDDGGDIKCLTAKESDKNLKGKPKNNTENDKNTEKKDTETDINQKIKRLESAIEQAKLNLSYTKIYAPQDGTISSINVAQGEYIYAGQNLISIIPKRVWVSANFTETQTEKMEIGQPVIVRINKYPTRKFKGMVESIKKVDGDIQDMTKNIGYVTVKIVFTEDYSAYDITPGTPAKVTVQLK